MSETFDVEPPRGTRIRMPNGRTFERKDPTPDFHWSDGTGWYRWSEVQGRARRVGGRTLITLDQSVPALCAPSRPRTALSRAPAQGGDAPTRMWGARWRQTREVSWFPDERGARAWLHADPVVSDDGGRTWVPAPQPAAGDDPGRER